MAEDTPREWRPEWRSRKADRPRCGARTRRGTPCKAQGSGRGGRCKNHGGMSTGPRTAAGPARCAAAVQQRWAAWRAAGADRDEYRIIATKTEFAAGGGFLDTI